MVYTILSIVQDQVPGSNPLLPQGEAQIGVAILEMIGVVAGVVAGIFVFLHTLPLVALVGCAIGAFCIVDLIVGTIVKAVKAHQSAQAKTLTPAVVGPSSTDTGNTPPPASPPASKIIQAPVQQTPPPESKPLTKAEEHKQKIASLQQQKGQLKAKIEGLEQANGEIKRIMEDNKKDLKQHRDWDILGDTIIGETQINIDKATSQDAKEEHQKILDSTRKNHRDLKTALNELESEEKKLQKTLEDQEKELASANEQLRQVLLDIREQLTKRLGEISKEKEKAEITDNRAKLNYIEEELNITQELGKVK